MSFEPIHWTSLKSGGPRGSGVARATVVSHSLRTWPALPQQANLVGSTARPLQGHSTRLHLSIRDEHMQRVRALVPRAIDLHANGPTQLLP